MDKEKIEAIITEFVTEFKRLIADLEAQLKEGEEGLNKE